MSERRILITGGAGFIGYHLVHELSQDSANYLVLVDNFTRGEQDEELRALIDYPNVDLISADLADPLTYRQLGKEYDEVYHLAAIIGVENVLNRPHEVLRVNAVATLLLLDWFVKGGGEKLLFSSTSEVYAWTQHFHTLPIPTPEDVPLSLTDLANPRSTYAGSKIFGELSTTHYCSKCDKPFVIVRYHNVYGPRMGTEHVIPELYYRAINGQNPLVVYSPNHSRAFCYVTDAISATVRAMRRKIAEGKTLNIGNDLEEITIGELAELLLEEADIQVDIESRPATHDPIVRRCPDISRARELLDYQPKVMLVDGLRRTLEWYSNKFRLQVP